VFYQALNNKRYLLV